MGRATRGRGGRAPEPRNAGSGFTLLEVVVVLALLALLTGVVAPSASAMLGARARRATAEEMGRIGRAALEVFDDTGALPDAVLDLLVTTGPSWCGPYVSGVMDDTISGGSGLVVDAWSRDYRLRITGDVLEIRSAGKDGRFATADDLALEVDATPVRRRWTLERLTVINAAIQAWNDDYLSDAPLPANYATIYATLTANGLLPPDTDFQVDGWGDAYVPDPAGLSPVVRVTSAHLP